MTVFKVLKLPNSEKTSDLISGYNNDYERLVKNITFVNGKITLLKPKKRINKEDFI